EQLEDLEVALGQRVVADVHLHPRLAVRQHEEVRLAEAADGENAAGDAGGDRGRLELGARRLAVLAHQRVDRRLRIEPSRIRIDAEPAQLFEIGAPLRDLIGFLDCAHVRASLRRIASSMPLMKRTDSSPLKVRASSSASLMMTLPGVSGWCRNS